MPMTQSDSPNRTRDGGGRAALDWARKTVSTARERRSSQQDLRRRVARLEAEVQECRALNGRLAELTDIVGELLIPVAARDEEKLAALLKQYGKDL